MSDRVSVISVTYNSAHVLPAMLASLPKSAEIIVVDNASADNSAEIAKKYAAKTISVQANIGFGKGCNRGADVASRPYLFFLNPDATIDDGALDMLADALDQNPSIHAANPAIFGANGKAYFRHRSPLLPRSSYLARGHPAHSCPVPVLHGSALFCRRDAFEAVGGFDDNIFLYHEDDDLSLRLAQNGGQLYFIKEASVHHNAGNSTVRSADSARFKAYHLGWSRVYAQRKHGRAIIGFRSLFGALAGFGAPHVWISARKRAKQAGLVAGVWAAIKGNGPHG